MQRHFSSFATSVLLLLVLGLLAAPTTTALGDQKQSSKTCPSDPLPDYETASGLLYLGSSLEAYKFKKPAAVFSFILAHRDVEIDRCEEIEVDDACCAVNKAQFVSVELQLDPERCATRKALKGLKVRIDGKIIPNSHVSVKAKAGTVTIKRVPRIFVNEDDFFDIGYDHSLDLIFPQDTECTYYAFQGRDDAWPCAQEGCDYLAVTTVDEPSEKSKSKNHQGRLQYPKMNATDCCVSVGTSQPISGDFITTPPLLGVGPPAGTSWCAAGTDVDKDAWDVRILAVGDWGANPDNHENLYQQKDVAAGMDAVAKDCDFERIINVGDNFYEHGLLGGRKIPFFAKGFRARFKQTWTDIYHAYASLRNLVWYGTYGNHDIGIYKWGTFYPKKCYAPVDETWSHGYCLNVADCCASPLWQTTSVVNDPLWKLEPGEYAVTVPSAPVGDPLIEFFFLDSNPYIDEYFPLDSFGPLKKLKIFFSYNQRVPGGLDEWRAVRNQTMDSFLNKIASSTATWKIPVIHTSLATYGKHCAFFKGMPQDKSPDDPINNKLDQNDCKYFVDLRRALLNMGIRLTMHGHDHSQQFAKLPAGYDGTTGGKDMFVLTTGAGCKQEEVAPGPADIQIWPRNDCGGGTPCLGEKSCNKNNRCATHSFYFPPFNTGGWKLNREKANVGFSSLHANTTHLMVRVFEKVEVPDGPGLVPNSQLVEVVQEVLTL